MRTRARLRLRPTPRAPAPPTRSNGIDVGLAATPTFADIDGDGDLDLVAGDRDSILNYYENTGTASAPTYTVRTGTANPFERRINVSANSVPDICGY